MSGTTLVVTSAGADISASSPQQQILSGTLNQGLTGHFLTNTSLTKAVRNLAPGGTQGASIVGAPTIGGGGAYLSTIGFTGYFNTGILETPDLTIILAVQTNDPENAGVNDHIYWVANEGLDAGQGSGPVGILIETVTTAPTNASWANHAYFGASFASKAATQAVITGQNDSIWHIIAYTVRSTSPYTVKIRNLTTGSNASATPATPPRQINTVLPFLIGYGSLGGTNAGTLNVASATFWNRELSDAECALMRTSFLQPFLLAKYSLVV